jgi:hypothetical protein
LINKSGSLTSFEYIFLFVAISNNSNSAGFLSNAEHFDPFGISSGSFSVTLTSQTKKKMN